MDTQKLTVLTLSGAPRNRGLVYGESLRDQIDQVLNSWLDGLDLFALSSKEGGKKYSDKYWQVFLKNTSYKQAVKHWAPELLEEVRGIAEGANQPFEKILALQLIDEEWIYSLQQQEQRPTNKCTAFGVKSGSKKTTFSGQNMDVPHWMEGHQTLLRIKGDTLSDAPPLEAMVFTIAGIIGLNGLNSSPLGVTCNTLAQLQSSRQGLPVSFIVRKLLSMRSMKEAVTFLNQIPHASGQNYILSTMGEFHCFECSASKVVEYRGRREGVVTHTNHPLENNDVSDLVGLIEGRLPNSTQRLSSITSRLNALGGSDVLGQLKQALSAHDDTANPVCRCQHHGVPDKAIGYTAGSSIYELGHRVKLHLAAGPPCSTAFRTFSFGETAHE